MFAKGFEQLSTGDAFVTPGRTVTEADVVAFGAQTGDLRPLHVDAEWAASSVFGERVAHGMLVLSYAVGLIPFDSDRVAALRRFADVLFPRPVRLGDTIHVEGSVLSLAAAGDGAGRVTLRLSVLNQQRRLVARARAELLWNRERPSPDLGGGP